MYKIVYCAYVYTITRITLPQGATEPIINVHSKKVVSINERQPT